MTRLIRLGVAFVPASTTRFPGAQRDLYPSFDDGPGPGTPLLLDRLDELGVQATFFFSGAASAKQPDVVRRAAEAGHTIGAHGHDHVDAWRTSKEKAVLDLARGYDIVNNLLGRSVTWVRPPHGHVRRATLRWINENGCRLALWDVDSGDYLTHFAGPDITRKIVREARPGSIVLLHENGPAWQVGDGAGSCVSGLIDAGFEIRPFPEEWIAVESKRSGT